MSDFKCEMDEYAQLVKDLRKSGLIKDHRQGLLTVHKNSFSGKEFVDWVVKTKMLGKWQQIIQFFLKSYIYVSSHMANFY